VKPHKVEEKASCKRIISGDDCGSGEGSGARFSGILTKPFKDKSKEQKENEENEMLTILQGKVHDFFFHDIRFHKGAIICRYSRHENQLFIPVRTR